LNANRDAADQLLCDLPGFAVSGSDKFAVALVAIAVCGYVAWVQIDCARDPHCHMNWCGKRPCGMSYDKQDGSR